MIFNTLVVCCPLTIGYYQLLGQLKPFFYWIGAYKFTVFLHLIPIMASAFTLGQNLIKLEQFSRSLRLSYCAYHIDETFCIPVFCQFTCQAKSRGSVVLGKPHKGKKLGQLFSKWMFNLQEFAYLLLNDFLLN